MGTSWISRKGGIFEKGGGRYDLAHQLWKFFSGVVIKNYRNQGQRPRNCEKGIGSQHCEKMNLNIMTLWYNYSEKYNKE